MKVLYQYLFLTVFFALQSGFSFAQSGESVDSLISILDKKPGSYQNQLRLFDEISWSLINSDVQQSLNYGQSGLRLATKVNDEKYEALFLRNIGVAHYMGDEYDSAHYYLEGALDKAIRIKDEMLTSRIYTAQANVYSQTSQYNQAIKIYLEALKLSEKLKMTKEVGKIYHNIGTAYQRMDNMTQALKNFEKSRKIAIEIDDTHSLAFLNMAISNIYMDADKPKALGLSQEALRLFKQHDNKFGEVMAMLTVAQCYYMDKNYTEAMNYAKESKRIAEQSDFPKLTIEALLVLSNINYRQGNYAVSETYAEQALAMDTTTSHLVSNLLENVLRSNIYLDRDEKAVAYVDKYRDHFNRFSNQTYQQSLSEMEVKYESEKKELRILGLEKEKRAYTFIIILGIFCLIILVVFFINRGQLMRQRVLQVEQEKQLVAVEASLEGETTERSRLARDLHDGLGSMLSVVKHSIPSFNDGMVVEHSDVLQYNKTIQLLDKSIGELRRIAHHMMPESLIRLGLKDSLDDFCKTNDKIRFQSFGKSTRLDAKLEVLIYRAVHELVTNALKHADASQINVQLLQDLSRISVIVQDDGKGFDLKQSKGGSMGLFNIQHRVKSFNGSMDVSSDSNGSEIHLEFKLI